MGADATNAEAVKKIFIAKGRPGDNPLIVHIAHPQEAEALVEEVPAKAKALMDAFWPGPLTLIMKCSHAVPKAVTAGLDTVALRLPSGEIARRLIEAAGVPIAAPSAASLRPPVYPSPPPLPISPVSLAPPRVSMC